MRIKYLISALLVFRLFISCSEKQKANQIFSQFESKGNIKLRASIDSVLSTDYSFLGDSVFPGHKDLIASFIRQYHNDTCVPMIYKKKDLKTRFEGFKNLGDINNDNKNDTVFNLEPLSWCEYDDGESYYFTDSLIPRIKSESYCCHTDNFFKAPDIDEDGINEVGYFYSSCASRYKTIKYYRLKNKKWEQIAVSDFDILTQDPDKVKFEDLIHKISKNKFRVKNFMEGKKFWTSLSLK